MAHIMKSKDFLFRGLICVFSSHSLLSFCLHGCSELVRSLTVLEDMGRTYLRKTKGIKFAGDGKTGGSVVGNSMYHSIDFGPVLPQVKIIHADPVLSQTLWNSLILNIYNLCSAQCLEHFCWYNSPL